MQYQAHKRPDHTQGGRRCEHLAPNLIRWWGTNVGINTASLVSQLALSLLLQPPVGGIFPEYCSYMYALGPLYV